MLVAALLGYEKLTARKTTGVLIGEPLGVHLAFGVAAVGAGIWLASSTPAAR